MKNKVVLYLDEVESNARTYAKDFPIVIDAAFGSHIKDIDGKIYIDCLSGAGTLALGHNHPEVIDAIKKYLDENRILHSLDFRTEHKEQFVNTLLQCLPEEFSREAKIQFCGPTGADAVEAAMKLFKIYSGRSTIITFHGAYHGMTNGALSLTGNLRTKSSIGNLMPGVHFMPYPYQYRCPFGVGGEDAIDINLNYFKSTLEDPYSGITKPAAVILEVVQGEGGCIPAPDRWIAGVRDITAKLDIPLIVDEIQTGLGRTGSMFAFQSSGIIPDAVLVSKAAGGGLPVSLLLYNRKYDVWTSGDHAGTFRGNQLAMVAGTATMQHILRNNLPSEAFAKGKYLIDALTSLKSRIPVWGDVRGRGLMIGIEIIGGINKNYDDPDSRILTQKIKQECLKRGLIVESGGRNGAVLRLLPPLNITFEILDDVIRILDESSNYAMNSF